MGCRAQSGIYGLRLDTALCVLLHGFVAESCTLVNAVQSVTSP